ncbi:MAG: hypothetical protein IJQ26_01955 [Lachnospiraceae bacterium]|nr:hypothetical protein [Lachnospiraceae bacterium]
MDKRCEYQRQAMTECKLLSICTLSHGSREILPKQYEQITSKVYDVQNLLGAWMKSNDRRVKN